MNKFILSLLLVASLCIISCAKPISKSGQGAIAGGALGAGTGAIIGSQSGHAGAGTAIGAGIGVLGGALVGNAMDSQDVKTEEMQEKQRKQEEEIRRQRRELEELKRKQGDTTSSDGYRRY